MTNHKWKFEKSTAFDTDCRVDYWHCGECESTVKNLTRDVHVSGFPPELAILRSMGTMDCSLMQRNRKTDREHLAAEVMEE